MEKITIQSTYTRVSLYARFNAKGADKPAAAQDGPAAGVVSAAAAAAATGSAAAGAAAAGSEAEGTRGRECARSQDGDTFTLSLEARTLQVSRTVTIETADKTDATGAAGAAGEGGRLTGEGFVNALLDAMDKARGGDGKRRHHFPRLSDAEDVSSELIGQARKEHAEKGGSRRNFADEVKQRLSSWKPSAATGMTVGYAEFRSQVQVMAVEELDAWAAGEGTGAQEADPAA